MPVIFFNSFLHTYASYSHPPISVISTHFRHFFYSAPTFSFLSFLLLHTKLATHQSFISILTFSYLYGKHWLIECVVTFYIVLWRWWKEQTNWHWYTRHWCCIASIVIWCFRVHNVNANLSKTVMIYGASLMIHPPLIMCVINRDLVLSSSLCECHYTTSMRWWSYSGIAFISLYDQFRMAVIC